MKILQINPVTGRLSTGRSTTELNQYFRRMGHSSYVATAYPTETDEYKIGWKVDRKIHSLLARLTGLEACFSTIPTLALLRYMEKIQPDIVKIGVVHSNYLNYYLLLDYCAHRKIPVVLVLNDCWHYTGKCVHYTYNNCMKWKTGCGACPHLENGIPTWFFDQTGCLLKKKKEHLKKVSRLAVVGVSQWITTEASQSILKDADIVRRIYNWVDLKKFFPHETEEYVKKLGVQNKKVVLGVASAWSEGKGLLDFIRLAEMLGDDYRIVLVGNVSDMSKVKQNMICVGAVNGTDDLAVYYSLADVFVSLSKEESFGKVSAEALACGTPIVCYNATACPELVGEKCGYVAELDNLKDVKNGILQICSAQKSDYSGYCIKYAKENFSFETNAEAYLTLFRELIERDGDCE